MSAPGSGTSRGGPLASLHGVIGALMALRHRDVNGGRGQVVDVALYEAVFAMMESTLPEYDLFGIVRERTGTNLTGIVPSNTYPTADAQHVVIGANADNIFRRLAGAMGRADLARDPQYLARGMIRTVRLPDGTPLAVPGIVPKLSDTPGSIEWVGPRLGEHTDEVLGAIGVSESERASLRERGVI